MKARARTAIWDISEVTPVPKGAVVTVEDYDSCEDRYIVEYERRIYIAAADELDL